MASSQAISGSGNINFADPNAGKSNLIVWGIVAAAVFLVVFVVRKIK